MFGWFRSKDTDDVRYVQVRKRVTDLELRVDDLEAFMDNIRNMARKVQKRREDTEKEANPEDLKGSVLIPE